MAGSVGKESALPAKELLAWAGRLCPSDRVKDGSGSGFTNRRRIAGGLSLQHLGKEARHGARILDTLGMNAGSLGNCFAESATLMRRGGLDQRELG